MRIRLMGMHGRDGVALRDFARRRMAFALGRYRSAVTEVRVRLDEIDDSGRGDLARCRIRAVLEPGEMAAVELCDTEPRAAITRAIDRLARSIRERTRTARRGRV